MDDMKPKKQKRNYDNLIAFCLAGAVLVCWYAFKAQVIGRP